MISEAGVNPEYFDISQVGTADYTRRIALITGISTEFRRSDNRPFLKIHVTDVNGRKIIGFMWNAETIQESSLQWCINHLSTIEFSRNLSGEGIAISSIIPLGDKYNEGGILQSHFMKKLANLDQQRDSTRDILFRSCDSFPAHKDILEALKRHGAFEEIACSRYPGLCDGVVGGRMLLLSSLTGCLISSANLYCMTREESRTVLVSAVVYEYLCARFQPQAIGESPMWKIDALNELATLTAALQPPDDNGVNAYANTVSEVVGILAEALGFNECATKLGTVLRTLRETFVKLSTLTYTLDGQIGDTCVVIDGVSYIK